MHKAILISKTLFSLSIVIQLFAYPTICYIHDFKIHIYTAIN